MPFARKVGFDVKGAHGARSRIMRRIWSLMVDAAPRISRDKTEAVLKAYNYDDIELQTASNGWSGTAIPASGGSRMSVTSIGTACCNCRRARRDGK